MTDLRGNFKCCLKLMGQAQICGGVPHLQRGRWLQELEAYNIQLRDFEDGCMKVLFKADLLGKTVHRKNENLIVGSGGY